MKRSQCGFALLLRYSYQRPGTASRPPGVIMAVNIGRQAAVARSFKIHNYRNGLGSLIAERLLSNGKRHPSPTEKIAMMEESVTANVAFVVVWHHHQAPSRHHHRHQHHQQLLPPRRHRLQTTWLSGDSFVREFHRNVAWLPFIIDRRHRIEILLTLAVRILI